MASSGKQKTTMAKLNRERKMRERRMDKQARKDARKLGLIDEPEDTAVVERVGGSGFDASDPTLRSVEAVLADA
jgi:hypothetical protein